MERTLEKSREETRNHTEESEAKDTIIEEELTSVREFTKEARTELVANRRMKEETERERGEGGESKRSYRAGGEDVSAAVGS